MQGLQVTDQNEITSGVLPSSNFAVSIFPPFDVPTITEGSWAKAAICTSRSAEMKVKTLLIYFVFNFPLAVCKFRLLLLKNPNENSRKSRFGTDETVLRQCALII